MSSHSIIERLELIYNGGPWYGKSILEGIQFIKDSDNEGDIRIRQLLQHMIAWRNYGIEQVSGNSEYKIELNGEVDWPVENVKSFKELQSELASSQEALISLVRGKAGDGWLAEKVVDKNFDFNFLLEGIIQHDIYHLGQLIMMCKENE